MMGAYLRMCAAVFITGGEIAAAAGPFWNSRNFPY